MPKSQTNRIAKVRAEYYIDPVVKQWITDKAKEQGISDSRMLRRILADYWLGEKELP